MRLCLCDHVEAASGGLLLRVDGGLDRALGGLGARGAGMDATLRGAARARNAGTAEVPAARPAVRGRVK